MKQSVVVWLMSAPTWRLGAVCALSATLLICLCRLLSKGIEIFVTWLLSLVGARRK